MTPHAHAGIDIVLVGGGHAHVYVLTAFAMLPEPGVRLTLITRDLETPYSGMLPGVVAGLYTEEQAHIDLVRLTAATGVRLIHADAIGVDRVNKRIELLDRPPIAYDITSIDVGITPALATIEGADKHAIAVKPIGSFINKCNILIENCAQPDGPRRIVVIGGGAGGVELLLSVRSRLLAQATPSARRDFSFTLVTAEEILSQHNARVRNAFRRVFAERGIVLHEHKTIRSVSADVIALADGATIASDAVLVTTDAAPPRWFAQTGLARDDGGFLAVSATLQVLNDPDVFGAGDCAGLTESPRPKSGVIAVRAGPTLAENLRRRARNEPMVRWQPQRQHLALISTGERYAVASRGWVKAEGAWVWALKDRIDRRWMRMYQDTDRMIARMAARKPAVWANNNEEMRCGGCAAKVGPGPLSRALARLSPVCADDVVVGLDAPDDAAVIASPIGKHLVQTVDFFRAFIDDPHVFGEIAANHALNDIFAMGGTPRHALATAVVPTGPSAKVEETLFQLLAGARACLDREGVALVGGHSSEGELAIGFSVTGEVAPDRITRKGGLKTGHVLILTRPLGTGILFAAAMRGRAKASWINAALAGMRRSNRAAAAVLLAHGATAVTDVTGFGLIGHLGEMLTASNVSAELDLAAIPLYEGALALARAGIASTLLPENLTLGSLLHGELDAAARAILFDPQTSGPLLAGIPADEAVACVAQLRSEGYSQACIIGSLGKPASSARDVAIAANGRFGR
ncbi:MAG: selenide, water dikinase [Hyphomicrobiales bacterium]|jgi:selenide,water dikinase|nr:selenide, water dikinase [Hyphomicrobiales bacterium]